MDGPKKRNPAAAGAAHRVSTVNTWKVPRWNETENTAAHQRVQARRIADCFHFSLATAAVIASFVFGGG
jgi:hypothetical protein